MKPYGVKYVGSSCGWGCCYLENYRTKHSRSKFKRNHRRLFKRRARRQAKKEQQSDV